MPKTPRARLFPIALFVALTGCTKDAAGPMDPPPASVDGPRIVATVPAARSEGVLYDTEIWAGFDRGLEASSVDSTSVFLKLDTQRVSCAITYEAAPRRIRVRPRATLQLQRTYTVEFAAALRALDGTTLGERQFFQFKTNSLRRPTYSYPDSAALEGPVVMLGWGGNGGVSSQLIHEVYASPDSAAVVARSLAPLQRATSLTFLPRTAWPRGTSVYWSVTTENQATGERLAGHVRRFETYSEAWPVDSVTWTMLDYGGSRFQTPRIQYCNQISQFAGPDHSLAMHFRQPPVALTNAAVVSARIYVPLQSGYADSLSGNPLTAWQTLTDFTACSFGWPGPPYPDANGRLGAAEACEAPSTAMVREDGLAAWFEQNARGRGLPGIQWRADRMVGTAISSSNPVRAVVTFIPRGSPSPPLAARGR